MYPCAGNDLAEPFDAYARRFDTLLFVDISYGFHHFEPPTFAGWRALRETLSLEGPPTSTMRRVVGQSRTYRDLAPAWWRCQYQHVDTRKTVKLVLRRGFGQYALHELMSGQLGMFLHRGDSPGEGGSGARFLENVSMSHAPLSMLLDVIKTKLSVPGLIGSDGSNTSIRQLMRAAVGDERHVDFVSHGLHWRRVGGLPGRLSRSTVVWKVAPSQLNCGAGFSGSDASEVLTETQWRDEVFP